MKHPFGLILTYKSLEGHEYTIDWLPRETAEQMSASLERLADADVAGWLTEAQITDLTALLGESGADEAMTLEVNATTFPLYIIANSEATEAAAPTGDLQLGESVAEMNTEAFNEATMCDGGPSRKETLRHAREAFRQIGTINETVTSLATLPSIIESLQSRIVALEGNTVPQAETPPVVVPAAEAAPAVVTTEETPVAEAAVPNADVPSEEADTPIADVVVESPLEEEGANPTSQPAIEEEPAADAVTETDPESAPAIVLSGAARSSLRRLSQGRRTAGVVL